MYCHVVNLSLQGLTTLSFIIGTWALARGAGVPARARLAANCMAAMALTQVREGEEGRKREREGGREGEVGREPQGGREGGKEGEGEGGREGVDGRNVRSSPILS